MLSVKKLLVVNMLRKYHSYLFFATYSFWYGDDAINYTIKCHTLKEHSPSKKNDKKWNKIFGHPKKMSRSSVVTV